jgi:hypothetical protein
MGKRTSIYLGDDLAAAVEKTGLPLAELVRAASTGRRPGRLVPIRRQAPPSADGVVVPPAGEQRTWGSTTTGRC